MQLGVSGSNISFTNELVVKKGSGCREQGIKILNTRFFYNDQSFNGPKVIDLFEDGYSMEAIHGVDAVTFLHTNGPHGAVQLLKRIELFLKARLYESKQQKIDVDHIAEKVTSVCAASWKNPHCSENEIAVMFSKVSSLIERADGCMIPIGQCHGDLTLSNMIFPSFGSPYLIDSIPVFLNSPMLDAAKALQDARHWWTHGIIYKGTVDKTRMELFCRELEKIVLGLFDSSSLNAFSALNLFRIIPYVGKSKSITRAVIAEIMKYD